MPVVLLACFHDAEEVSTRGMATIRDKMGNICVTHIE